MNPPYRNHIASLVIRTVFLRKYQNAEPTLRPFDPTRSTQHDFERLSFNLYSSSNACSGDSSLEKVEHLRNAASVVEMSWEDSEETVADGIATVADDVGLGRVEVGDLAVVLWSGQYFCLVMWLCWHDLPDGFECRRT